jgi:hypothetical protein
MLIGLIAGEIELTIMRSFCTASGLRRALFDDDSPEIIRACRDAFLSASTRTPWKTKGHDGAKPEKLPSELRNTLTKAFPHLSSAIDGWSTPQVGQFRDSLTVGDHTYTTRAKSKGDSNIFYQPGGGHTQQMMPGRIEHIITVEVQGNGKVDLLFVFPLLEARVAPSKNPFLAFPDLGISIWAAECASVCDVITSHMRFNHFACMPWDEGTLAVKDMNRVL